MCLIFIVLKPLRRRDFAAYDENWKKVHQHQELLCTPGSISAIKNRHKTSTIDRHWVTPEKIHTPPRTPEKIHTPPPPPRRKFLPSRRVGENKLFLIIVSVLGDPKGVGGLTSNFLHRGGMDFCAMTHSTF